ncbi:Uncharacterised protein [Klebsiella michiganensis]|uniref:Uncharacterized protein n=1 Tax=Klebsiella michiganensis TaxID=1134687 RepID=A0A7H4N8J8_9ENTR|nr:Uncharacterised protein [Klebsiella michiganensis]
MGTALRIPWAIASRAAYAVIKEIPNPRLAQAHGGGKEVAAIGRMKLPSGGFKHGVHMALQAKAVGERDQAILRKLIDGDGGQGSNGMLWRDHGADRAPLKAVAFKLRVADGAEGDRHIRFAAGDIVEHLLHAADNNIHEHVRPGLRKGAHHRFNKGGDQPAANPH